MPLYEYRCKNCGKIIEQYHHHVGAPGQIKCPVCHDKAKRIISQTSFALKEGGVGWAKNGYHPPKA